MSFVDRFVAIGVGTGDSFFLEYDVNGRPFRMLVDGGQLKTGLRSRLFEGLGTEVSPLDVAVCTHADSDHVNGLISYFSDGGEARELWVPGKWRELLERMSVSWEDTYEEIVASIRDLGDEQEQHIRAEVGQGLSPLEAYGSMVRTEAPTEEGKTDKESTVDDDKENDDFLDRPFFGLGPHGREEIVYLFWRYYRKTDGRRKQDDLQRRLMLDAIETEKKIRDLVHLARRNGSIIRWYEYAGSNTGTFRGAYPEVINARSHRIKFKKPRNAVDLLTPINRDSLVVFVPGTQGRPPVLFCGDSDLSFTNAQSIPIAPGTLITAAHHGSKDNSNVAQVLASQLAGTPTVWVRSDRLQPNGGPRPAPWYLNSLPQATRYCTQCRGSARPIQHIALHASPNGWVPASPSVAACTCV
ncbi:MAG: hypothetical protein Q8M65_02875 [Rhodoglobus sp.]|nr:hypothetical protein [Rhodoglobus sp.]